MKKLFALFLVLVLTLSLTAIAFAVPTSQGGKIEVTNTDGTPIDPGDLEIKPASEVMDTYYSDTPDTQAAVEKVNNTIQARFAASEAGVINTVNLKPVAVVNIKDKTHDKGYSSQPVTLSMAGIADNGQRVVVLRYNNASDAWEKVADNTVQGGKIQITADSYDAPFLFMVEENSGNSDGSYTSARTHTFTTSLEAGTINAVFVDGKKLDSKNYVIYGSNVTLTEDFMSTLSAGKHTIRIENATRMATADFYVTAGDVVSPKTADTTPVSLLVSLAVVSALGCAYCVKRSKV